MQIRISYLPKDGLPPEIETLSTPWRKDWDNARAKFVCRRGGLDSVPGRPHQWCLEIEQRNRALVQVINPDTDDERINELYGVDYYTLLSHECKSLEEYVGWLEETVLHVCVDGEIYWANPRYSDLADEAAE